MCYSKNHIANPIFKRRDGALPLHLIPHWMGLTFWGVECAGSQNIMTSSHNDVSASCWLSGRSLLCKAAGKRLVA